MDGQLSTGVDVVQRHLDDLADPVLVHLVHRERLDVVFLEDLLFTVVDVAQTDVDKAVGFEDGLDPGVFFDLGAETQEERYGHAVDVAWLRSASEPLSLT